MTNQEELERIIKGWGIESSPTGLGSPPYYIYPDKLAEAILDAGYHKGKVIEGEEAVEFLKDAGYVKKDSIELDVGKMKKIITQFITEHDYVILDDDEGLSIALANATKEIIK